MKGENEKLLHEILNEAYPKQWVLEHQGITGRKFRFDCANPCKKIAVEIEGGIWLSQWGQKSRHTTGIGYAQDLEKYNLAVLDGWRVLRYTSDTLKKRPWQIIRDIRTLCGASSNTEGQTVLNFDNVKSVRMQMQVKLGV